MFKNLNQQQQRQSARASKFNPLADYQTQFQPPMSSQRTNNNSTRWRRIPYQPETQRKSERQQSTAQLFEPQFIKQKAQGAFSQRGDSRLQWQYKATREGFLYFYIPGTNTFQWNFPVVFDPVSGRKKTLFAENWHKKHDAQGRKFYRSADSGMTQEVKPDSETYLIQAAMLGNICFLNLYLKARGFLGVTDKRGRTALHHSCANGHKQLTQMLCEFGSFESLLETADSSGNTPILTSVKYRMTDIVKLLIQFNCNLFQRNLRGDSILHVAALNNSQEVLPVLASFITEELFTLQNRDGMSAMDVATSLQNFDFVRSLEVIRRNLTVQNALAEREAFHPSSQRNQQFGGTSSRTQMLYNEQKSQASQNLEESSQSDEELNDQGPGQRHQAQIIQETERTMQRASMSQQRPSINSVRSQNGQSWHQQSFAQQQDMHYKQWKVQKKRGNKNSGVNQRPEFAVDHDQQYNSSDDGAADEPSMINVSSSRIQESYFDDEMQAKVSRSARARHRQLSQRAVHRRNDILEDRSQIDRAMSQTTRVVYRIGTFFQDRYRALINYLYTEAPRFTNGRAGTNRVMQAPVEIQDQLDDDDSMLVGHGSHQILNSMKSRGLGSINDQRSRIEDDSLVGNHYFSNRKFNNQQLVSEDDDSNKGSEGYITAFSRSRSRSVANLRNGSRSARQAMQQADHLPGVGISSNIKLQKQEPQLRTQRSSSQRQVRFPQEIEQEEEKSPEQEQRKEVKSISVQADPVVWKSCSKKVKAADLSKRSIGVGSLCIDETIEVSRALLGSLNSSSKTGNSKRKSKRVANHASKRYLSSDRELKLQQQSQSQQLNGLKHDQTEKVESIEMIFQNDSFKEQVLDRVTQMPQQQVQVNSQDPKQETHLEVLETPQNQPNSKLKAFYEKLAEHEQLSDTQQTMVVDQGEDQPNVSFNPQEQDEENYQHQHDNRQYFDNSVVEQIILNDLCQEQLDDISDCSFIPRYQSGDTVLQRAKRPTLSQASVNQLDKGQFVQQSCGSIVTSRIHGEPSLGGHPSRGVLLAPCLTPLMSYQSDSEAPKRRIKLPKLPILKSKSPTRPPIANTNTQQNDSNKIKATQVKPMTPAEAVVNMFSEVTESQRLKNSPSVPEQMVNTGENDHETEPPSELFTGNETVINEKRLENVQTLESVQEVKVQSVPPSVLANKSQNHRYGDSSQTTEDLTLLNFELSKDISQSYCQGLAANTTHITNNNSRMLPQQSANINSKVEYSGANPRDATDQKFEEIFPPKNLNAAPIDEEQSVSKQASIQSKKQIQTKTQLQVGHDFMDELDTISRIIIDKDELLENDSPPDAIDFDKKPQVIPPSYSATNDEESKLFDQSARRQIQFYKDVSGPGDQLDSDGIPLDEGEVIFQSDPNLGTKPSHTDRVSAKQNRSTTAALFKNHFLSSASEDDEGGQNGSVRRDREKVKMRERIKCVSLAAMHSSVNNGQRSNLPLYGQRVLLPGGNQKTISQVTYKKQESQSGDQPATTAASETQGESGQKTISVSDRFKASLKAFKTNKLIKGGIGSTMSMNSSKLSVASLSQRSHKPNPAPLTKDTPNQQQASYKATDYQNQQH